MSEMRRRGTTLELVLAWVAEVASLEPFELEIDGLAAKELVARWLELGDYASSLDRCSDEILERFLFVLQFSLAEAVWAGDLTDEARLASVKGVTAILPAVCRVLGRSQSVFGFWDVFLRPWAVRFAKDQDHMLISTISSVLLSQLQLEGDCLKLSALHGINHLGDPRTAESARALVNSESPDVVEYAERALAFLAP